MTTKIVIWATNEKEEKLLLTLELLPKENKVEIWSIPEKDVTDQLESDLIGKWKKNEAVELPANASKLDRPLSISESILPDNIRVEKGADLIRRSRTEWPVIVLSYKLHDLYENELGDIKNKVESMTAFSGDVFDELKGFWGKVQGQIRDRSLLRSHSENLRGTTNELFDALKKMRASLDKEYRSASADLKKTFITKLDEIENQIETGRLSALFDELKAMQNEFKSGKFTKGDRTQIWNRIDAAFKKVKEKKYGPNANKDGGSNNRLQKRYDGLLSAMDKMERSIQRDKSDLNFQNKRINNADGQLEAQLREAKLAMIQERIRSKDEKLTDMKKTKAELETKLEAQKLKDAKKEKEKEIKAKIAQEIKAKEAAREQDKSKLTALGSALTTANVKPAAPVAPVNADTPVAPAVPDTVDAEVPSAIVETPAAPATVETPAAPVTVPVNVVNPEVQKVAVDTSANDSFTHAVNTAISIAKIDNKGSEEE